MIISPDLHRFGSFFMDLARGCHIQLESNVYMADEDGYVWFVKTYNYCQGRPECELTRSHRTIFEWQTCLKGSATRIVYDPDAKPKPQAVAVHIRKVEL